ncbi:MAG: choice-of-anchor D domain-containing protein, partial [Lysobacterales bacterium]
FRANLHLLSNDPESPDLAVPVTLQVTPAAAARISATNLAFGNVEVSGRSTLSVDLADSGCGALQVTGVVIDNPAFRADAVAPFEVEPGAVRTISVSFTPSVAGPASGTMVLATNDPNQPDLTVGVAGMGVNPARIMVTPAEISAALGADETGSAVIHIENNGGVALEFSVPALDLGAGTPGLRAIPGWALVAPTSGTIPGGGSLDLTVTLNSTGLSAGTHRGVVHLLSNDLLHPDVQIPLTLVVQAAEPDPTPTVFSLAQNVPNPFHADTLIRVGIPGPGTVELRIFDIRGALVRTLATGPLDAGFRDYVWDGREDDGGQAPAGVYFCRLKSGQGEVTRRMMLMK